MLQLIPGGHADQPLPVGGEGDHWGRGPRSFRVLNHLHNRFWVNTNCTNLTWVSWEKDHDNRQQYDNQLITTVHLFGLNQKLKWNQDPNQHSHLWTSTVHGSTYEERLESGWTWSKHKKIVKEVDRTHWLLWEARREVMVPEPPREV